MWPLLNDYLKALIIHQGKSVAEREREKLTSLSQSSINTHIHTQEHTGALNMLSLVWPGAISFIYP